MKYRLRWAKRGKLRYVSHHDEALIFERSARRAGLPLQYSKGFSAHPKIAFGSGLPVGYASEVELLDVGLTHALDPTAIVTSFNEGLPDGLRILAAAPLPPGAASLGALIEAADYLVTTAEPWVEERLGWFLGLDAYEISRPYKDSRRTDDVRAGVIAAEATARGFTIRTRLKPRSTRPTDVFAAMGKSLEASTCVASFERTALLTDVDGELMPMTESWNLWEEAG
jgi:radical SAM-linked protein